MHACIHTYTRTCICIHTYIHTYAHTHLHTHILLTLTSGGHHSGASCRHRCESRLLSKRGYVHTHMLRAAPGVAIHVTCPCMRVCVYVCMYACMYVCKLVFLPECCSVLVKRTHSCCGPLQVRHIIYVSTYMRVYQR